MRILLHTFNSANLLGEAGNQNGILLLEQEEMKLCFKVKGGEAQIHGKVFFGKLALSMWCCLLLYML